MPHIQGKTYGIFKVENLATGENIIKMLSIHPMDYDECILQLQAYEENSDSEGVYLILPYYIIS